MKISSRNRSWKWINLEELINHAEIEDDNIVNKNESTLVNGTGTSDIKPYLSYFLNSQQIYNRYNDF